jgi:16S rRNA processing protein RimM
MDKVSFFCLGKISKTFGYKGQVIVIANCDNPEKYKDLESVFVEIKHERIPFFITEFSLQFRNSIALKLEDIDSSDQAQKLLGCNVYIPESEVIPGAKEEFKITDLAGFEVTDVTAGYLGKIDQILELPQQHIMQIFQGKKEILIPLNEDFIKKIDLKKRSILIAAPEGLIEFYQQ